MLSYRAFLSLFHSRHPSTELGRIPNPSQSLIPARSLLPDWFSHDPRAPPCYQGDAAVTCQFRGGDAHRHVMAQNRMVGEFPLERVALSPRENEQLIGETSQLYADLVDNYDNYVCLELTGCCSDEWLQRDSPGTVLYW